MKLLRRLSDGEHEQRKSVRMARLIAPLVLALMVFGFLGFFDLNQTSAHAASSCGDTVVKSQNVVGGEYGAGPVVGLVKLIKNTCTKLYRTEFVCAVTNIQLTVALGSGEGNAGGFYGNEYGAVSTNCNKVGQVVDSGTHAQDNAVFCALSAGGTDISNVFVEYGLCVGSY